MLRGLPSRIVALKQSVPSALKITQHMPAEQREQMRVRRLEAVLANVSNVADFRQPSKASLRFKQKPTRVMAESPRANVRPIFSFSWLDQARHRLLLRRLMPFANFHCSQVLLRQDQRGRGRSAACEYLHRLLPQLPPGHVFIQFDVRNFFGSISHAWLEKHLGLRQEVVRHHVHTGGMLISTQVSSRARPLDGDIQELVRRGIPGGSALSPLIGELVMADVLREVADHLRDIRLVTYCDNLGVFCAGDAVSVIEEQLREAFRLHGAGPFELTSTSPISVHSEFRFLGYWWRRVGERAEIFVPPEIADTRLLAVGEQSLRASLNELGVLRQQVLAQAAEWKHWDGALTWRRAALDMISSAASHLVQVQTPGPIQPVGRRTERPRMALPIRL